MFSLSVKTPPDSFLQFVYFLSLCLSIFTSSFASRFSSTRAFNCARSVSTAVEAILLADFNDVISLFESFNLDERIAKKIY